VSKCKCKEYVNLRKLLSGNKSHARESSFFTGAIPNQVRYSQIIIYRFVSVPDQNPERSSREGILRGAMVAIGADGGRVVQE